MKNARYSQHSEIHFRNQCLEHSKKGADLFFIYIIVFVYKGGGYENIYGFASLVMSCRDCQ